MSNKGLSEEKKVKLKSIAEQMNPASNNDLETFLGSLKPEELKEFQSLETDEQKEAFYEKIIENRTSNLRLKMGDISIEKYMATDPSEITEENLRDYLSYKTTQDLENELAVGINEIQRHYVADALSTYVEKRQKYNFDGTLDTLCTMTEVNNIKAIVQKKIYNNPIYKMSLLVINNTSGSITLFNDKMVESKRDYEIYKTMYCNERGMTPESFDNWQEYVKTTLKEASEDPVDGFSNMFKLNTKEWHLETFKKFYKKVPNYVPGETIVYESKVLKALEEYDNEKDAKAKNPIMKAILEDLDKGIANNFGLDDDPTLRVHEAKRTEDPNIIKTVDSRRKLLRKKKAAADKPLVEIKEETPEVKKSKPSDSLFDINIPKAKEEKEVIPDVEITGVVPINDPDKQKEDPEVVKDIPLGVLPADKTAYVDAEELATRVTMDERPMKHAIPSNKDVVITSPDPSDLLKAFRSKEVEDKVIVRYDRKPDTSLLRKSTISDPKARMQMYKNSAVVNGFQLYLPYSGYDVIVKKLQDKSRINYLFTLLQNSEDDLSTVIEQEVHKIVYDCLEFPDKEAPSYIEFTKNLCEGDIPIIMIALAMTNIPENENGRVILPISSLRCSNRQCDLVNISVDPIEMDLYDLFSKIYPLNKYVDDYKNKLKDLDTVQKAYRSSSAGRMLSLTLNDEDDICKFTILMSKPTIYKDYSVKNQSADVNYDLVKDDILERPDFYANKLGFDGLEEYIKPLSYSAYTEKHNSLTAKIALLDKNKDEFTEEEIDEITEEINQDMTPITMINNLLMSNISGIQNILKACKYVDAIKVTTTEEEEDIISVIENHDNLIDMIRILSTAPVKLLKELFKKIDELTEEFEFEHENVYYDSKHIKGRMSKEFVARYSKSTDKEYKEFIKTKYPDVTDVQLEQQLKLREEEFENIKEGRCTCGNDRFYINYISIVFFSIFNKSEVVND